MAPFLALSVTSCKGGGAAPKFQDSRLHYNLKAGMLEEEEGLEQAIKQAEAYAEQALGHMQ